MSVSTWTGSFSGGGAPAPTYAAPIFDDFGAPLGTISARTTETGAATWAADFLSGSNTGAIGIVTAGSIRGSQGTTPLNTFNRLSPPATANEYWMQRGIKLVTTLNGTTASLLFQNDHATISGGTWDGINISTAGASGALSSVRITPVVASVAGTFFTIPSTCLVNGDTIETRYSVSGPDTLLRLYINGAEHGATASYPYVASGRSVTLNGTMAIRGNIPATDNMERVRLGRPATDALVSLYAPARVLQRESNGDVIVHLAGDFGGGAPASLEYQIEDTTGGVLIAWSAVQSYAVNGLTFTGLTARLTSPPAGGFITRVRRSDVTGGGFVYDRSPVQYAGQVLFNTGQSLNTYVWNTTTGATISAPSNCWSAGGSRGFGGTVSFPSNSDRRYLPIVANSAYATFIATVRALVPSIASDPWAIGFFGRGGTTTGERLPGTAENDAQRDGIKRAGLNYGNGFVISGEFDTGDNPSTPSDPAVYVANTDSILTNNEALTGNARKYAVSPVGSIWGFDDALMNSFRKRQWMMAVNNSTRYFQGPYKNDLQHLSLDVYHLTDAANHELARRMAFSWAKMNGYITHDRNGPRQVSATRSGDTVTVTYDLLGFDSLDLINGAVNGDYTGGHCFSLSSSFGTLLFPISTVTNAVSGTTQSITFTFTGGTITGPVYVSGPYGSEPFNRFKATAPGLTIRAAMATQASMVVGIKASEPNVAMQPFYDAVGSADYVVAA